MSIIGATSARDPDPRAPKWFPFLAAPPRRAVVVPQEPASRRGSFCSATDTSGRCRSRRPRRRLRPRPYGALARARAAADQSAAVCARHTARSASKNRRAKWRAAAGRILTAAGRPADNTPPESAPKVADATSSLQLPVRGAGAAEAQRPVGDDRRLARRCAAQPAAVRPERTSTTRAGAAAVRTRNSFDTKGVEFGRGSGASSRR